jgi:hypothetical protein
MTFDAGIAFALAAEFARSAAGLTSVRPPPIAPGYGAHRYSRQN